METLAGNFPDEAEATVLRLTLGAAMIDVAMRIVVVVLVMGAVVVLANYRSNFAQPPVSPIPEKDAERQV